MKLSSLTDTELQTELDKTVADHRVARDRAEDPSLSGSQRRAARRLRRSTGQRLGRLQAEQKRRQAQGVRS